MSTTIRKPDDWQVGDRAYVKEPDVDWSKGDIFTVKHVGEDTIGKGRGSCAQDRIPWCRCYRILTRRETNLLVNGDTVVKTRGVYNGDPLVMGEHFDTHSTWIDHHLADDALALVSLVPRRSSEQQKALDDLEAARKALTRAEQRIAEMNI